MSLPFFQTVTVRKWASTSDSASQPNFECKQRLEVFGGFLILAQLHLNFAALDKTTRRLSESLLEIQVFFLDAASVGLNLWGMRDTYRDKVRYDRRELRDPSCVVLPEISSIWILIFLLREVFLCSNRGSVDRRWCSLFRLWSPQRQCDCEFGLYR